MMPSAAKASLLVFLSFFPTIALADAVVLQTGEILEVETSWSSRDRVYFSINGLKLSIPRRYVKRIEGAPAGANPSLAGQESDDVASAPTNTSTAGRSAEPLRSNPVSRQPDRFVTVEQTPRGNAFRGLSWGDRLADSVGMQDMGTQTGLDNVAEYVRPGDVLKLGQARLESIVYAFWRERLYTISIWTHGLSNYTPLRRVLFEKYGDQESDYKEIPFGTQSDNGRS